ncbi:hypothetical protein O7635_29415 [Asanoa sp. WMMD1127]|uniref:hypothetical protein n=1 Tax=Asanoa sp. WMMD1127 TaxID=3016107 RepID=UPI0024161B4D|nr:hypothetical protein [Asanoa sp. WMMD1127]MDG4825988.1 hypothetical protein [Asanoa sp. WMMD1127]
MIAIFKIQMDPAMVPPGQTTPRLVEGEDQLTTTLTMLRNRWGQTVIQSITLIAAEPIDVTASYPGE